MTIDAYAVLGVSRDAPQSEVKAAHRRLVRLHHPDLVAPAERAEATRRVQEINVAYGLVRDPAERAAYDRLTSEPGAALDELVTAAGVWAGRWWARNRRALGRADEPVTRRAGRAVGRLLRRV